MKRIEVDGPIRLGGTGRNHPTSGPPVPFTYTEVTPLTSYTEVSRLPGARAAFTHRLTELPGGRTHVVHGVEFSGPLAGLYKLVLRGRTERGMQAAPASLIPLVEAGPPSSRGGL